MEQINETDQLPEQLSDILLVYDKEKMKIQAVKGIGKDGELETVDPDAKNKNQFMKVDKHGNAFSNFFSNFLSQLKNPTPFTFFKVPETDAINIADKLQKHLDNPTKEGEKLMDEHQVKPEPAKEEQKTKNQNDMQNTETNPTAGEYRYTPEQVDWQTLSNLGLSKERLEKMNLLDPLLKGYKTNELVPISVNLGTAVTRLDARLALQPGENGMAVMAIHGIRKEANLSQKFFGHEFTKEDKENLLKTGNMGRVVELTNMKTQQQVPHIISIDRLTNEVIALRADRIKVPDEIKGVKLDDSQKQALMEGKPLHVEGMMSKKNEPFDATVQFNADKRYIEFLFDRSNPQKQAQSNSQSQSQEAPKIFRGQELDKEQYDKFKAGETIYVDGLKDKKGKEYQGYITFNKDTGKTDFAFPNQVKVVSQPIETHKTQIAVNSEGKTNEATKNLKEPLKSGQNAPDSKKQKAQQEKPKTPAKGRKM